jgi:hypothetical protein
MAGEFTASALPTLPGGYFDFLSEDQDPIIVNPDGIVALPFVHNWGPANQVVTLNALGDFTNIYGNGGTNPYTAGYKAVRQAFDGEAVGNSSGAAQVLAYRMVGSAGAAATLALLNATPATGLTLTAVYKGSWANTNISVTVIPTPSNPTITTDINIYVQGNLAETWTFAKASMAAAAALINANSSWVTATVGVDGSALATVSSPTSVSGGNDGATLLGTDWTTMMAAFNNIQFGVFAPYDLTDPTILASLVAWGGQLAGGLNNIGHRCMFVTGGALNETGSTAATRAESINDPNFVTIGVGSYSDSLLGALSTSQLAPRLAGIIAARGGDESLTFARLARLSITSGPSYTDIINGLNHGFMAISQDSNPTAPVRFEKGVTTWSTSTNQQMPVNVFGNPKFVVTMQEIDRNITQWYEANVIGKMPVTDATVQLLIAYVMQYLKGVPNQVQPTYTVQRASVPAPTPQDDFIALTYQITFTRSTEQVLNTVIVG